MASLTSVCRLSARVVRQKLGSDAAFRGFRTAAASHAAQNFTMPALSPTMTEGTISAWRVKEGDNFLAGDVLLEIETDKATMDVEAQDDGIMMKITQGDGSKAVQVGARIAVIAEEGDDISQLEIPPDEASKAPASKPESASPAAPKGAEASSVPGATSSKPAPKSGGEAPKQKYPLYPSVAHLLKENGFDEATIGEMTPTGPNGRLLKGDVLAYMGRVKAEYPSTISARFAKDSHLDLSKVKVARTLKNTKAAKTRDAPDTKAAEVVLVEMPISLDKATKMVGTDLPLSVLVSRAAKLANENLPLPSNYQPSADELFNKVLGLNTDRPKVLRGSYLPSLYPSQTLAMRPQTGIIDFLAGKTGPISATSKGPPSSSGLAGPQRFELSVPKAEAQRARVFMVRFQQIMEKEPERLII